MNSENLGLTSINNLNSSVILIVDDHIFNLELLCELLEKQNWKVLVAKDGEMAIKRAEYAHPDLILLDVMMPPGIDGFETCRRLKSNPETAHIPVIFMTALSDTEKLVKGLSIGAVDYIVKPFQNEEVLARIRLHLKIQDLHRQLASSNTILEQRVKERTEALNRVIQELQDTQKELLEREEKLSYLASHDPLTGLLNRWEIMEQLNNEISKCKMSNNYLFAMLFIDLDRFKIINDSFGHIVGDSLLTKFGQNLQKILGETATIGRFGGDEFVILLKELSSPEGATEIARKILEELRLPLLLPNNCEVFITGSIGIALGSIVYQRPGEVLRDADIAMYEAKKAGKGCYAVFKPKAQTIILAQLTLENELRRAINNDELCLYYQPIVCLKTGRILSFEGLVRWNHPQQGTISPNLFIPIAEETGLIHDLGEWVLQAGCQQLQAWVSSIPYPPCLNLNLSLWQLQRLHFLEVIEHTIANNPNISKYLKLEITESCMLENRQQVQPIWERLGNLGIKLCIDDFGTGYSSLSRLHELPVSTLKIDRSFVNSMDDQGESPLIQAIIALAHSLQMETVAEGIETRLQLQKIINFGCQMGQGYLFSKAVTGSIATDWLRNQLLFNVDLN